MKKKISLLLIIILLITISQIETNAATIKLSAATVNDPIGMYDQLSVKGKSSSITLNKKSATIKVKGSFTLKPTVLGQSGTVKWSSSNTAVATVTQKGKVTGKKKGTATITASVNGAKATCKVTVVIPVSKVTLNKTTVTLTKGKTITLKATVSPSSATKKTIKWTSSNSNIATVNSKGVVSVKAKGTATITAKATDGSGKKATCKVTVKVSTSVPNVTDTILKKNALDVAKYLGLTQKISYYCGDYYDYYYIRKGRKLFDGSPRLFYPDTKTLIKGNWDLTIEDKSIAFQGIKIGMSASKVKSVLSKKWTYEYKYSSYGPGEYGLMFSRNMNYSWSWLDRVQLNVTFDENNKVISIEYYTDERE